MAKYVERKAKEKLPEITHKPKPQLKVEEKNWAAKLKDKVVKHFADKKKKEQDFQAYAAKMTPAKKVAQPAKKETVRTKQVSKGLSGAGLTADEIARFKGKKGKK